MNPLNESRRPTPLAGAPLRFGIARYRSVRDTRRAEYRESGAECHRTGSNGPLLGHRGRVYHREIAGPDWHSVGRCRTLTDPATPPTRFRVRCAATTERLSLFVSKRRVSLPAGPQERIRTVGRGNHLKGRNEVEDLRSRLTAVGDRALPDAGDRPALVLLPASGPATAASTAGPNRRGGRNLRAGFEGAEPLASPLVYTRGRLARGGEVVRSQPSPLVSRCLSTPPVPHAAGEWIAEPLRPDSHAPLRPTLGP